MVLPKLFSVFLHPHPCWGTQNAIIAVGNIVSRCEIVWQLGTIILLVS